MVPGLSSPSTSFWTGHCDLDKNKTRHFTVAFAYAQLLDPQPFSFHRGNAKHLLNPFGKSAYSHLWSSDSRQAKEKRTPPSKNKGGKGACFTVPNFYTLRILLS